MNELILLTSIILELAAIFLISKLYRNLVFTLLRYFFSEDKSLKLLGYLIFPGVLFHELSHIISAGVLLLPVGSFQVSTQKTKSGISFGTSQVGQADPFRQALVALAPTIFGTAFLIGGYSLVFSSNQGLVGLLSSWQVWIYLLMSFQVSLSMFSSKKDLAYVLGPAIFLGLLLFVLFKMGYLNVFKWQLLNPFLKTAFKALSLTLVINVSFLLLAWTTSLMVFSFKKTKERAR